MAHLINTDENILFDLSLYQIYEDNSWLGYNLKIKEKKNKDEFKTLFSLPNNECPLYLGVDPEKEIDLLFTGIKFITEGKISSFLFEPVDEKDFALKIQRNLNEHKIQDGISEFFFDILSDNAIILENTHWKSRAKIGISMNVTHDELQNFASNLWQEYQNILSQKD